MTRELRSYTKAFREEAVSLSIRSASISDTAKDLGIPKSTLNSWVRKQALFSQTRVNYSAVEMQEELKRLRKENVLLQEERSILKKAAAYFAKEYR